MMLRTTPSASIKKPTVGCQDRIPVRGNEVTVTGARVVAVVTAPLFGVGAVNCEAPPLGAAAVAAPGTVGTGVSAAPGTVVEVVVAAPGAVVEVVVPASGAVVVVAPGTVEDVVVAVVVAHGAGRIWFVSSVTDALRANSRPSITALVFAAIVDSAMIVPVNVEPTPSVAELPTCQNTLQACAPLIRTTELSVAVISVEPAWKMKTESGLFWPSSVSGPVIANDVGDL